ncbi:DUF898 family protein [Candidatus Saccharibacteria bacterium]|nr:DUF898 family protein [Candidatus Saccharibacteria bacterium]MCA9337899.1 DUF898 family protein [Candidatus Saccharibacteria bacterium]
MDQKPLKFSAGAGSYFVVAIVVWIATYIPIFGWAFALNFFADWLAKNSEVNGQKVHFTAGYGESLKFIFINTLLLIITLGIYTFWFVPKLYRYVADHTAYGAAEVAAPAPAPAAPVAETPAPEAPAAPEAPKPPTPPVVQ